MHGYEGKKSTLTLLLNSMQPLLPFNQVPLTSLSSFTPQLECHLLSLPNELKKEMNFWLEETDQMRLASTCKQSRNWKVLDCQRHYSVLWEPYLHAILPLIEPPDERVVQIQQAVKQLQTSCSLSMIQLYHQTLKRQFKVTIASFNNQQLKHLQSILDHITQQLITRHQIELLLIDRSLDSFKKQDSNTDHFENIQQAVKQLAENAFLVHEFKVVLKCFDRLVNIQERYQVIEEYATRLPIRYFSKVQKLIDSFEDPFLKPILQINYVDALIDKKAFELAFQVLQNFPDDDEKKENLGNLFREFYLADPCLAIQWIKELPSSLSELYFEWLAVELVKKDHRQQLDALFKEVSIGKIAQTALAIYECEKLAQEGDMTSIQKALQLLDTSLQQRALKVILKEALKQEHEELVKKVQLLIP